VVFGVCPSDRDDGEPCLNLTAAASDAETGGGGRSLYATDLPSYMGLAGFRPQKTFDYCATCLEAKDYCELTSAESRLGLLDDPMFTDPEDDNDGTDDDEEEESDGAIPSRRVLEAPINYVSCETCRNLGCYEDVPDSNETMMGLVQWVQAQSLCQPTGQSWDVSSTRLPLYSSFACNAAGTGAEVALFLDDGCQLRIASLPYSSVLPDDYFVENGENVISYPFTNDVDCFADPNWRVPESSDSRNSSSTVSAPQQTEQAGGDEVDDANRFCQALMGEGDVVALDDCGNWTPEEEEEGESEPAASTTTSTAAESYFDQWTYTLRGEDARRRGAACAALRRMEGGYGSGPNVPTKATNGTILPPSTNGGDGATSSTSSSGASSSRSAACAWKSRQLVLGGAAVAVGAALAVGLST
jgi:hypothetical protein